MSSEKDPDAIITSVSRIASCVSIVSLLLTAAAYIAIVNDIERSAVELEAVGRQMQAAKTLALEELEEYEYHRGKRQSWFTSVKGSKRGRGRGRGRGRHRYDADADDSSPRVCDCAVITCPRGPRGKPGTPGKMAEDGISGEPGQKGVDGIMQVEEGQPCPPCPRGPRGPDGEKGEQGERGKSGIPGEPGKDGINEPGIPGPKGIRGQAGRNGEQGQKGEAGRDFVQLVGVPGPKGPIGAQGLQGPRGDPGEPGIPAEPGSEGLKGAVGEPGEPGETGHRGKQGARGPPGKDSIYCECPPRDGSGIASKSGLLALSSNWEYYNKGGKGRGRGKATISENFDRGTPSSSSSSSPSEDYEELVSAGVDRNPTVIQTIPPDDRRVSETYSHFSILPSSSGNGRFPGRISTGRAGSRGGGFDDTYAEPRKTARDDPKKGGGLLPGDDTFTKHSPASSIITYKDSSEQNGINNRVIIRNRNGGSRKIPVVNSKGLDFEFRRRLRAKLRALRRKKLL